MRKALSNLPYTHFLANSENPILGTSLRHVLVFLILHYNNKKISLFFQSILTDHVSKTFNSKRIHSEGLTKTIHRAGSSSGFSSLNLPYQSSTKSNPLSVISKPKVIITINEGETFIVQIPNPPESAITLNDLKNRMPIKGDYRYFIKDYVDGEACFVEMIRDVQILPVFEGKIIVKCRSV